MPPLEPSPVRGFVVYVGLLPVISYSDLFWRELTLNSISNIFRVCFILPFGCSIVAFVFEPGALRVNVCVCTNLA